MKRLKIFLANVGLRRPTYPLASPPMGILYLAAYLRKHFEADFVLINQREDNIPNDDLLRKIRDFAPDVVGFSSLTPAAHSVPYLTESVRSALPKALILLGGPHASSFQEAALEGTSADASVPGEGELAFEQILRRHLDGSDFSDIPGVHWRDKDGRVVSNPGRLPYIEDLDSLPFPAYDLIDIKKYWRLQSMPPIPRRKYISLTSSRGCPYHCGWCHRIFGDQFRFHSADRIADEVEHYVKTYGVNDIEFLDDIFNYDPRRVLGFNRELHKRNIRLKIAFPNGVRGDMLTEEVIDSMVDSGTYFCSFALETGTPRLQKLMGKHLNIPRFLKAVEMAVNRGIFANGFVMLGFPTETEEEMLQTIRVATDSYLHTASFFTVVPFPGTQVFRYAQEMKPERLVSLKYDNIDFSLAPVNLSTVPDEVLFGFQRQANRQFFGKPSRIYRIMRDFPQRRRLPYYIPIYVSRVTKDLFKFGKKSSA